MGWIKTGAQVMLTKKLLEEGTVHASKKSKKIRRKCNLKSIKTASETQ